MNRWLASAFLAFSVSASLVQAAGNPPKGLLVREDAQGNRVVFRADEAAKVSNTQDAEKAIQALAVDANRVTPVAKDELDQVTSQEAWYYYYYPTYPSYGYYPYGYYYNYSCYWYGSYYNYYPYYYYPWGGYSWYYYWRPY